MKISKKTPPTKPSKEKMETPLLLRISEQALKTLDYRGKRTNF